MELAELRKTIAAIERRSPRRKVADSWEGAWSFGMATVDGALPEGRLDGHALHDVTGASFGDGPAAAGFALMLLSRLPREGDVLWCQFAMSRREYGGLYGPGLVRLGFDPARLVQVSVRSVKDLAWVMEEGLRSGSLAAVVGEGPPLSFTATRRLSLAAAETAQPSLFIADPGTAGASEREAPDQTGKGTGRPAEPVRGSSAAATRWRVASLAGEDERPAFHVELLRCRGGQPGSWRMVWDHETRSFHPLAPLRDGEFLPQPAFAGRRAG